MIIHLKNSVSSADAAKLAAENKAFHLVSQGVNVLVTGSGIKEVPAALEAVTEAHWVFPNDMQLASRNYRSETREVKIGNVTIGGKTGNTIMMISADITAIKSDFHDAALRPRKSRILRAAKSGAS